MYTNKSALDDALHSMQRRIVQAIAGCGGVIVVAGGVMAAPDILSESSVNAALAKLALPVQAVGGLIAAASRTDDDRPILLASADVAEPFPLRTNFHSPMRASFAPAVDEAGQSRSDDPAEAFALASHAEVPQTSAIVLASLDSSAIPELDEQQPAPAHRPLHASEEEIPTAVYEGPDALKLVQTPVPQPRPADLTSSSRTRPPSPAEVLGLTGQARARAERCLTQAVYFEARSEPYRGQVAVAQVVMNRVFSPYYPGEVCAVVFQNAHRYLSCQFTFACEGRPLRVTEHGAWRRAQRIAQQSLDGRIWRPEVAKATHYHADYVSPNWIREMRTLAKHGRHIFYRPHRWGDGREEAGWVAVHESPIPRPRPVEVAARPITVAAVQDAEGLAEAAAR